MRAYARDGAAEVVWPLVPAVRPEALQPIVVAANEGFRRAAFFARQTHLVDLPAVFTPGFKYRETIVRNGRTVDVRLKDGVHFSDAGAKIAAELIARAVKKQL